MRTEKQTDAQANGWKDRREEANRSFSRLNTNGPKNGQSNSPPVPLAKLLTRV
jgi:hypothetical protein